MASLGDLIVKIGANIDGFKDAMGQVLGSLDSFSSQAASAGAGLSVLAAPLAAIGTAATAAGLDFESAMKTIRAGTGETGSSLEALGASFTKVFGSIPATAHDAAEAITIVFQRMTDESGARLAGQQLEDFSSKMLNLARITHSEVVPLAETVTRVFKDWGMSAKESSVAMDFLYKAAQQNGVAITKMTENLVTFGAPLRGLGFDFETATAMIARFEKEGVPLQTALAAMRYAIANFAKGGLDAKEALSATIEAIKSASTSADQMSIGLTTVGKRGMTDFVDAVKMGRFDLEKFTQDIKDNTETIDKSAAATLKFSEQWQLLKNNLEIALKPVGDTLLKSLEGSMNSGFLKGVIDEVHSLADAFASLDPSTQALIVGLASAAVAAGPALIAFGAVAAAVSALGGVAVVAGGALAVLTAAFMAFQIGGIVQEAIKFADVLDSWIQSTAMAKDYINALCDASADGAGKVGLLGKVFLTMKSDVASWFGSLSELPWMEIISPLSAIKQLIADATLELQHSMGVYPEFAGAVNRMSTAVAGFMSAQAAAVPGGMGIAAAVDDIKESTSKAAIQFKLAKGAWEQLKNEQSTGVATSDQVANALVRLRAAAAAAGVDISKLVGDTKAHKEALKEEADALADVKAAMDILNEDAGDRKVTADIDKLYSSLRTLFKAYQDGRISLQDYEKETSNLSVRLREMDKASADAADTMSRKLQESFGKGLSYLHSINGAVEEITNSIWDQMKSGAANGLNAFAQQVALGIQKVAIDLKDVGNIFKVIGGTEADGEAALAQIQSVLSRAKAIYANMNADEKAMRLETLNDLQRLEMDAAEKTIAIERKTGKEVTDAQIESLRAQKVAWTNAHMDTEQAYKELHITSTKFYDDELATAQTAYEKIKNSALSSQQDILKGQVGVNAAELADQQTHGDRVTDLQKQQLAKMQEIAALGKRTWASQVDEFAVMSGNAVSKGMDAMVQSFLAGKLSLKKAWDALLEDLSSAVVKAFVSPITKGIGEYLAVGLSGILGGKGLAGFNASTITNALGLGKSLTGLGSVSLGGLGAGSDAITSVTNDALTGLGVAATGASTAVKLSASATSAATTATTAATSVTSASTSVAGGLMKSLGGLAGAANIANAAIGAISGIVSGVQQAHANSLLDKIEKSTREVSTVMWQTGTESVQGILKNLYTTTLQVVDRLIDLRTALFDPVAKDLEDIYKLLSSGATIAAGTAASTQQDIETYGAAVADAIADTTEQVESVVDNTGRTAQNITTANDSATATAQAFSAGITSSVNDLSGTITQSNGEIINALGQTSSSVVQNAANNTQAVIDQIASLGSDLTAAATITGNAYSDLKSTMIGVEQHSNKQLGDYANELSKQISEGIFGATQRSTSYTDEMLQKLGLEGKNPWVARSGGDNSNKYTGATEFNPLDPISGINVPVNNPLVSPGMSYTPSFGYVAPSPYTAAPTAGQGASYARISNTPIQYATQGDAVNVNIYGNVTGYDEANKMGTMIAENVTRAVR